MKHAHSPVVPSLDLLEELPAPQHPIVEVVPPCPLMLIRRSGIASQPISMGDDNNNDNNIISLGEMGHDTPSTTMITAAATAAVAGLGYPKVLRTMSDSCIPRAPRMSSSEPNPLFLERIPQLSLPPPSVKNGGHLVMNTEKYAGEKGGHKLSSSLRERMGSLATSLMHFTATSCPSSVGDTAPVGEWQVEYDEETRPTVVTGLLGEREGGAAKAKVEVSSASLTALSLLINKAFSKAEAGGAGAGTAGIEENGRNGVLTGVRLDGPSLSTSLPAMQLPPPALAVHTIARSDMATTRHIPAHAHGGRKDGDTPFSFSAFTNSTAATTASSVSSASDGLGGDEDVTSAVSPAASALSSSSSSQASYGEVEEEEEAVGSPSADATMGPFMLEELNLNH
ncbi:hypothetical protein VYU27_004106 [Nannochloropsis oceanica]